MRKLLVILFALFMLASLGAQERVFVNIGTGGTAGTYYPLGGAMAELISKAHSGCRNIPFSGFCKFTFPYIIRT